jgi:hypothetical protein
MIQKTLANPFGCGNSHFHKLGAKLHELVVTNINGSLLFVIPVILVSLRERVKWCTETNEVT